MKFFLSAILLVVFCLEVSYSLIFPSGDSRQMSLMLQEYKCKRDVIMAAVTGTKWADDWKEVEKVYDPNYRSAWLNQKKERLSVTGGE